MEVLFHFIIELVKISILSCIYGTLIFVTFNFIGYYKPDSWFASVARKKLRLWFLCGLLISVGLLIFMFTYFGNHGLGDNAILPVGHFKVVKQTNGSDTYLENSYGEEQGIKRFMFDNDNLYAETKKTNSQSGDYLVWNLHTDSWVYYNTKDEYLKEVRQRGFPHPEVFQEFWEFYKRHWHGWRFWTLP